MIRSRTRWAIAAVIVAIPVAIAAWWLASPLFINANVDESFPLSRKATLPAGVTRSEAEQVMSGMAKIDQPAGEAMPAGAEAAEPLKQGSFRDADSFHKGSGRATIYRLADGTSLLRLEDFQVTNGPDLHVYLSSHANPAGSGDVTAGAYLDLRKLKGNIGNQNYAIPAEADPADFQSAVIYCQPFHVVFSVASLQ